MNERERIHILKKRNLYLIKNTKITPTLVASIAEHLSDYDTQALKKIGENKTPIDQASEFYELVATKEGLYNPLIEALESEPQYGPANCLRELLEEHRQQPKPSANNGEANRLPNPQQYGNQPYLSHQTQEFTYAPAPTSQGQGNTSQTSQAASSDMKKLMELLELNESEVRKLLDFVKDETPLNVVVQTPTQNLDYQEHPYNLPPDSKGIKGYALFLNIIKFDNRLKSREAGANIDMEYMSELWDQLGYKIFPKSKKDRVKEFKFKDDIKRMIGEFKEACEKGKPRSIVVFIGSHGGWNTICTSDPEVDEKLVTMKLYEEIVDEFSTEKLRNQPEKQPKIFLVQTCQDHFRNATDDAPRDFHISDTIVCTAQVPGAAAYRDPYKGSWFVYCLTWVFMNKAHKCTLREMLDIVKLMMENIHSEDTKGQMVAINDLGMKDQLLRFYLDP